MTAMIRLLADPPGASGVGPFGVHCWEHPAGVAAGPGQWLAPSEEHGRGFFGASMTRANAR